MNLPQEAWLRLAGRVEFEAVTPAVLQPLVAAQRGHDQRLRLWSAGCASGEEVWSLATLLGRLLPDLADWRVSNLATDIRPEALCKAEAGVYGAWSFRGAAPLLRELYFERRSDGRHAVAQGLRRLVDFRALRRRGRAGGQADPGCAEGPADPPAAQRGRSWYRAAGGPTARGQAGAGPHHSVGRTGGWQRGGGHAGGRRPRARYAAVARGRGALRRACRRAGGQPVRPGGGHLGVPLRRVDPTGGDAVVRARPRAGHRAGEDRRARRHCSRRALVVSDVEMPRLDGFGLTARIRAEPRLHSLPVVLVTALGSRSHRERGLDAGADAYIVKSGFDHATLVDTVRRLLGKH